MEYLDYNSYAFFSLGYPLLVVTGYFFPLKIKSEEGTRQLRQILILLVGFWVIRGVLDFIWGISFAGNTVDGIVANYSPILIALGFGIISETRTNWSDKLWFAALLPFLYWLLYLPIACLMMIIDHPILVGNYSPKEYYDGRNFRIEQGGEWLTMSDQFNGNQMRCYRKYRYLLLEKEVRTIPAYPINTLLNIRETNSELRFDVKFNGIQDTIRGWVVH